MTTSKPPTPIRPATSAILARVAAPELSFPPSWLWLVDELLPTFVKENYSPRESWKDKPFSKDDAKFYFKGIEDLSEIFTEERSKALLSYFNHSKYRSGYLLYFLPLQAAKFLTLLQLHPKAFESALEHAEKTGVFRVADLGAGPGTASLAVVLAILDRALRTGMTVPTIELEWLDTNRSVMEDGKLLMERFANQFPRLRGKVTIRLHENSWDEAPRVLTKPVSLMVLGHVLNENAGPTGERGMIVWQELLKLASGGGLLMVEPASRRSSQQLSQIRDRLFEQEVILRESSSLWGPCLHAEACPLAEGRDWCHFSVPIAIPGNWFREFSKGLGSERQWLKFSYVWFAAKDYPSPRPEPRLRRVISDPLISRDAGRGQGGSVLVCEPEAAGKLASPAGNPLHRGDLVRVKTE
ncbi:MAG: small ribosomal subunit Rsm22 family protein [Bdellovibrionota bacterium]